MYRRLRNWFVVGLLLILAAGFARFRMDEGMSLFQAGAPASETAEIEDSTLVERGDIVVNVSATGSIIPRHRLAMLFPLPGKVAEVFVEEGDVVTAGQELARLETSQLELALEEASLALELQQIAFDSLVADPREEDLAVARAAVYAASTQLTAARSDPNPQGEEIARLQYEISLNQLWQSQLQRDSVQETIDEINDLKQQPVPQFPPGVSAQVSIPAPPSIRPLESGIDQAEFGVAIAQQQLTQAQNETASNASIAAASAAIVNAQSQLDRLLDGPDENSLAIVDAQLQQTYLSVELARHQLSLARLEAPFAGVVTAVNLVEGEAPPATQAALELLDDSAYYIDLAVDEMDIASVELGQGVTIELDAFPGSPVSGQVTRTDRVATNLGGLITYTVRVTLNPSDVALRVGMSATANIVIDEALGVLRLRNRFIRIDRRTNQAYVVVRQADDSLQEVEVVLGRRNDTYSEIVSGLSEGAEVVLLPRTGITDFGF